MSGEPTSILSASSSLWEYVELMAELVGSDPKRETGCVGGISYVIPSTKGHRASSLYTSSIMFGVPLNRWRCLLTVAAVSVAWVCRD